jgi:hypothetical protein
LVYSDQISRVTPAYIDVPVLLPEDDTITLDKYLGTGMQPDELALPDDKPSKNDFLARVVTVLIRISYQLDHLSRNSTRMLWLN